jgi:methylmalonyl-CoA/ethylmalonyl-CoA epimerase
MERLPDNSRMPNATAEIRSLGQVSVTCLDVERATAFYRDILGLRFLFSAGPGLAFFQLGDTRLMLSRPEGEVQTGTSTLYFKVENSQSSIDRVRPHADVVAEPHMIAHMGDHELWMAFFRDTEGNLMAFMEERPVSG